MVALTKSNIFATMVVSNQKIKSKNKNKNKMENINIYANDVNLHQVSWKYYNSIKKKAMEQEFSWAGLLVSLSIAFFIVAISAQALNLAHKSIVSGQASGQQSNKQLYRLERIENNFSAPSYSQSHDFFNLV